MLLAVLMLLISLPVLHAEATDNGAAGGGNDRTVLAFTSDIHNDSNNIAAKRLDKWMDRIEDKSDVVVVENTITISLRGNVEENIKNALNYIKSKGFKLEKLPYADHIPEFKSLENIDPEIAEHIKEGLKKVCIWKISVDKTDNVDVSDDGSESFNADASVDGDRLNLTLSGNLDSLSSPELLANYEKIKKDYNFTSVLIDCTKLEFVSSAGLRVLLIMQNDCEGEVIMKFCNESVIEAISESDINIVL